ncbi:MAG: flagellar motor protein MotA [Proteobacteria bacterium]|nr:flagellar motor protein MotA [Pseudomonadota bacterium]
MTDTKTYLTRMIIFLAIVGAGSAFVAPQLLNIFLVNPVLNTLIFGVIITGIVLNFRQVMQIAPEAEWIESFQTTSQSDALTDERLHPNESKLKLLSPMARMLQEKRTRGRLTISAPVMRTLLDGIGSRLEESRELSRYFTGLCIFLGLLGTFWGLLGTIESIADVIRNLSVTGGDMATVFNNLKSGLESPLSGMSTAFASSLFGLGGSLALGFLDLQAGQAQNAFYNELEEWLSGVTRLSSGSVGTEGEQGVSAYTEALLEQTAESLQELQNIMARGEQSRVAGNEQLHQLNDKLSILADQMRAEQQVLLRLAEGQRDLSGIVRSMSDIASAVAAPAASYTGGMDDVTRGHIRNIDSALTRLASSVTTGREEIVREIRGEIKLLAKTIATTGSRDSAGP